MYDLNRQQKLKFVLEEVEKLGLTAYDIAKKSNLTEAGIQRILKGTAKNPHENSLNEIITVIENKVLGIDLKPNNADNILKEPTENYYFSKEVLEKISLDPLNNCLNERNKLTLEVIKLQKILSKNNIKFIDIFEEKEN